MKKILYILCFTIFSLSCKAQEVVNINQYGSLFNNAGKYYKDVNNVFDDFVGTWQWQNGSQTFKVTLWKETMDEQLNGNEPSFYMDEIRGHFQLLEMQNQNGALVEVELYNSHKKIGNTNKWWQHVISGDTHDGIEFSGLIRDVSIDYPNWQAGVGGHLKLTIIPNTPLQMQWEVSLPEGMYGIGQPTTFNIPTDITLTKLY
ncbi:DUF6705 family protein [Mesonia ostreae]|uniref:DUF6705 domain-containing protein n=1 Tax=Mesonia ostreae TaxID=861110 RepID=A0ABU2KJW3_9FLAO|nr:DUF6705 family protein [Mesonia ostreae]MDT0295008.1 hypothetical protein [Mesonia ostreae]